MKNNYIQYSNKLYLWLYSISFLLLKLTVLLIPPCTERVINGAVNGDLNSVKLYSLGLIIITLLFLLFMYLSSIYRIKLYSDIQYGIKRDIANKILKCDYLTIQKNDIGFYLQRHNTDIDDMSFLFFESTIDPIINAIFFVVLAILMFFTSFKISAILLFIVPIFVFLNKKYIPKINKDLSAYIANEEKLNNKVDNIYSNNHAIRATKSYDKFMNKYLDLNYASKKLMNTYYKHDEMYNCIVTNGLLNLCNCLVYIVGAFLVLKGEIEVGTMMALVLYFGRIWSPVEFFLGYKKKVAKANVSKTRIDELLQYKTLEDNLVSLSCDIDTIAINTKDFYINNNLIIKGMELELKRNNIYLIKGDNGSGKTTLFNIISGIYQSESEITIDGNKYDSFDVLKNTCYYVTSELFLAEDDVNLSSGQKRLKQLEEVANRDELILIFDEPINYLDKSKIKDFIELVDKIKKNKIILISSHIDLNFEGAISIKMIKANRNNQTF